jgi:hypothetical protein
MVHTAASEGAILLGGFYAKGVLAQSSFIGLNALINRSVISGLGKPHNNETVLTGKQAQALV